ncbi:MAG: hypothetical protein DMG41_22635 [Acidobacteria bacterium]|nr:MAG: hypothetical protein AUH13_22930 [Acidobacteria bacterium 13_2_20CM_58_27]PYT85590.1 MAG: hypothetical protein DMG41_22635 [Acidobacteriota bacterium]
MNGTEKIAAPKKIEGATALQRLRPLPLGRKVFEALRLNLCGRVNLASFPGKRNLQVSLWKAVHGCAKTQFFAVADFGVSSQEAVNASF